MIPFRTLCARLRAAIQASPEVRERLDGTLPSFIDSKSSYSYRVDAGAFLVLCARVGIDPVTGDGRPSVDDPGTFQLWHLGVGCAIRRDLLGLHKLRDAAPHVGVSAATICRLERSLPISIESVLAVCAFVGVHPLECLRHEPAWETNQSPEEIRAYARTILADAVERMRRAA